MKLNFTNIQMRILNNQELGKIRGGGYWIIVDGVAVYIDN